MTRLFAALGHDGAMRFVGEVERGAACGCLCPECGSPLVAKQGNEKDWHFAHEGGQERPECEAGATNMLRRLAVEYLRKQGSIDLPPFKDRVKVRSPLRELSEEIICSVQIAGSVQWTDRPSRSSPVGRAQLEHGGELEIFVEIGDQVSRNYPSGPGANACIVYWSTLPVASDLRKRVFAEQHLSKYGRFIWRHHPDSSGLIQAARQRLSLQAKKDEDQLDRIRRGQAEEAGRDWVGIAGRFQQHAPDQAHRPSRREGEAKAGEVSCSTSEAGPYDWAPERKPGTTFIFYRLRDGAAWVIYTLQDGSHVAAAFPSRAEGWEEALPPKVGTPDLVLGVYRVPDLVPAMTFLASRAAIVRATSDPSEFECLMR